MVRHYAFTTFLKYNFCEHYFVIILYALPLFSSCIAKGLAMCRLGGVISFQKVLFLTLFLIGFERFLCTNYYN